MSQDAPRTDRAKSRQDRLATALESLPELDRLVLSLYLLENLTVLEIAGALATIARQLGKDVPERRAA